MTLKETSAGCQENRSGSLDDLPEQAFYMVGSVDEAKAKAAQLKQAAA